MQLLSKKHDWPLVCMLSRFNFCITYEITVLIWTWTFPTSALMILANWYSVFPICQYPHVLSIPIHKTSAHSGTSVCQRRALFYFRQPQLPYDKHVKRENPNLKMTNITWVKKQSVLVYVHTLYIFTHEIKHLISCKIIPYMWTTGC